MAAERWNGQRSRDTRPRSTYSRTTGRRMASRTDRYPAGKREETVSRGERRRMLQMTVSAVILVAVVLVKLTMPEVMEAYRQQILKLLGENTDFVAAFSSVGRVVTSEGGVGGALNDAYTAVFGPAEPKETPEKTPEETPPEETTPGETPQEESTPQDETPQDPPAPETEPGGEPSPLAVTEEGRVIYTPEITPANACLLPQVLGFSYVPPIDGAVTSGFGYREHPISGGEKFHYGMDIAADPGTVIGAFAAGTVTVVGEAAELGKYVMVSHPGDYTTLYAHCSTVTASSGQQVAPGDPIAEVGDTGMTTGPHLHFELHRGELYLNPVYYVSP